MKLFMKAKNWQYFILIMLGYFFLNFTIEFNIPLTIALKSIGFVLCFFWILIIGHGLYDYLPKNINLNYDFFVINFFIWLASYVIIIIISDGKGMIFHGFAALVLFYVFFAFIYCILYTAKTLKTVEKGEKVETSEYIGAFFLILFLPIGIWFLQPRINKIINNTERDSD